MITASIIISSSLFPGCLEQKGVESDEVSSLQETSSMTFYESEIDKNNGLTVKGVNADGLNWDEIQIEDNGNVLTHDMSGKIETGDKIQLTNIDENHSIKIIYIPTNEVIFVDKIESQSKELKPIDQSGKIVSYIRSEILSEDSNVIDFLEKHSEFIDNVSDIIEDVIRESPSILEDISLLTEQVKDKLNAGPMFTTLKTSDNIETTDIDLFEIISKIIQYFVPRPPGITFHNIQAENEDVTTKFNVDTSGTVYSITVLADGISIGTVGASEWFTHPFDSKDFTKLFSGNGTHYVEAFPTILKDYAWIRNPCTSKFYVFIGDGDVHILPISVNSKSISKDNDDIESNVVEYNMKYIASDVANDIQSTNALMLTYVENNPDIIDDVSEIALNIIEKSPELLDDLNLLAEKVRQEVNSGSVMSSMQVSSIQTTGLSLIDVILWILQFLIPAPPGITIGSIGYGSERAYASFNVDTSGKVFAITVELDGEIIGYVGGSDWWASPLDSDYFSEFFIGSGVHYVEAYPTILKEIDWLRPQFTSMFSVTLIEDTDEVYILPIFDPVDTISTIIAPTDNLEILSRNDNMPFVIVD